MSFLKLIAASLALLAVCLLLPASANAAPPVCFPPFHFEEDHHIAGGEGTGLVFDLCIYEDDTIDGGFAYSCPTGSKFVRERENIDPNTIVFVCKPVACPEGYVYWTPASGDVWINHLNDGILDGCIPYKDPIDPPKGDDKGSTSSTSGSSGGSSGNPTGSSTGSSTGGGFTTGACGCPSPYTCGEGAFCKMVPNAVGDLVGSCVDKKTMNHIPTNDTQKCILGASSSGGSGTSSSGASLCPAGYTSSGDNACCPVQGNGVCFSLGGSSSTSGSSSSGADSSSGGKACLAGYAPSGDGACCPVNGVGPCYTLPGGGSSSTSSSGASSSGATDLSNHCLCGSGQNTCVGNAFCKLYSLDGGSKVEACTLGSRAVAIEETAYCQKPGSGGGDEPADEDLACVTHCLKYTDWKSCVAGCLGTESCGNTTDTNSSTPGGETSSGGTSGEGKTFFGDRPAGRRGICGENGVTCAAPSTGYNHGDENYPTYPAGQLPAATDGNSRANQ